MRARVRSRLVLAAFALLFLVLAVAYVRIVTKGQLWRDAALVLLGLPVGILVSGFTERYLTGPAERFMNLVTGFGTKGQDAEFDERGVPIVSLRRLGEKFYNPVAVAMAGLRYYDQWERNNDPIVLQRFRNCCDSLIENQVLRHSAGVSFGVWEYHYPFTYGLLPPWISGLAQGVGAQILSRCYRVTRDERYRTAARQVLECLFVAVRDGGVTYKDTDEEWWYEEFVGEGAKASRALNGMIYALLGIYEYRRNTDDRDADVLFRKGTACLRRRLGCYDTGGWTYYDALGTLATRSYHSVHVELIGKLFEITGDQVFLDTWRRWAGYRSHFFRRTFVWGKPSWHDLVVLSFNVAGAWVLLRLIVLVWP